MSSKTDFLGKGWSFPPSFNKDTRQTVMAADETDITQSLEILIGTQLGERVMNPDYGNGVSMMTFGNATTMMTTFLENSLKESLIRFEPRVIVNNISMDMTRFIDGYLSITIDYTVRTTNNRRNIVYPFFLHQGNLIPERLTAH